MLAFYHAAEFIQFFERKENVLKDIKEIQVYKMKIFSLLTKADIFFNK